VTAARLGEHHLLGHPIVVRIQAQRRFQLGELVVDPLLVTEQLGQQRVRLDAPGVERQRAAQVGLGSGAILPVNLGQRQAHLHVVAVAARHSQQPLEGGHGGVGVTTGQGDLAGQEQRGGLVVR